MANKKVFNRVVETLCFECCCGGYNIGEGFSCRPAGEHSEPGGRVELNGRCQGCPIGALRGDGAPICKGKPSPYCADQLIPVKNSLTAALTIDDLWEPCAKCPHAEMADDGLLRLKDLYFCLSSCPARELLDLIREACAEAAIS